MTKEKTTLESRLHETLKQVIELTAQNTALRVENSALKWKLEAKEKRENRSLEQIETYEPPVLQSITKKPIAIFEESPSLSKSQKIALFRKLFRGREDVYPVRWENPRSGKSGYSPAIKNKWKYLEAKKLGNRNVTPHYLPLTDEVILQHLEGKIVAGVYALLTDDTCWFLAVDFDDEDYEADATSFRDTCQNIGISAYLERSRSCNGAHVWIFFEQPISASLARQLGFFILTKTMERRHQIALKSYDRLFPNQDMLPKGGFGNLIALPLQRESRERGGSVFLGADNMPVSNQWQILSSVQRVARNTVENIVSVARQDDTVINVTVPSYDDLEAEDPWTLPPSKKRKLRPVEGPFPETVKIVRANLIYVDKGELSPSLINRLRLLAAFQNPEFFKNQAMRLPVYDKPRVIDCSEDTGKFLALPRGCFDEVVGLFSQYTVKTEVEDLRYEGKPISTQFKGTLRLAQGKTVTALLNHDLALLSAPTAFGKTVLAAAMIARRGINTLVLVHRQQLIDQWKDRLQSFLDLPQKSIGQFGAGKKRTTGIVDVAMIQSLVRQNKVEDLVAEYGHIIIDECHHVSAFSFEQVLKACKAKYVLGLTATPQRKDGHHPIIFMQCGPLVNAIQDDVGSEGATQINRSLVVRETGFTLPLFIEKPAMHDLYQMLTDCDARNRIIAADVEEVVNAGHYPLVLTERVEHLETLDRLLQSSSYPRIIFKGGMGKKQRKLAMDQLASNNGPRIILATGRYIGEGFDDPKLDTLFLALPISWTGTLSQYVGRLHRTYEGKTKVRVYDYVDSQVPTLQRMFKKRLRGYRALGYSEGNQ